MSIFKKKIDFGQFLADIIKFQFEFLENNFNEMIVLVDEFGVLSEKDKDEYAAKTYDLLIADIFMSCNQQFYKKLSSEEIGQAVSAVYLRYMIDFLKLSERVAEGKVNDSLKVIKLAVKAEDDTQRQKEKNLEVGYKSAYEIDNEIDKQKFYLCRGFSSYCAGDNMKSENWEGKNFAAFKLAKGIIKTDIVSLMLKDFKINWK